MTWSPNTKKTIDKFVILIPTCKNSNELEDLVYEIRRHVPDNIEAEIMMLIPSSKSQKIDLSYDASRENPNNQEQSNLEIKNMDNLIPVTYFHNILMMEKIQAILEAVKSILCNNIILMRDDFSDPPQMLPLIMDSYINNSNCIVIAKEDMNARPDSIKKNLDDKLVFSELRTVRDRSNRKIKEIFSNYVAFPRKFFDNISIVGKERNTYLESPLEIIDLKILEIPYEFTVNSNPDTKFSSRIWDYAKSVMYYYRHGPKFKADFTNQRYENSVVFLSKAIRFYTVGASGLLINYVISTMLTNGMLLSLWYIESTLIGILASITSNFFLNKIWTFQDRNFSLHYTLRQFLLFLGISCFGALIQLGLVYIGVEGGSRYWTSLLFSITVASISNFLLNKKFTFHERLWG